MRTALQGLVLSCLLLVSPAFGGGEDVSTKRIETESAHACFSGRIKGQATRATITRGTHVEFRGNTIAINGWVFSALKDPQTEVKRMVSTTFPGHATEEFLLAARDTRQVVRNTDPKQERLRTVEVSDLTKMVYSVGSDAPQAAPVSTEHLRTDFEGFDPGKFLDDRILHYIRLCKRVDVPVNSPFIHLQEVQDATHRFDGKVLTYFNEFGGFSLVFAVHPPFQYGTHGDIKWAVKNGSHAVKIPKSVDKGLASDFAGTLAMFDLMQELSRRTWLEGVPGHSGRIPLFEVAMPDMDPELLKRAVIVQELFGQAETLYDVTNRILSSKAQPADAQKLIKDLGIDPGLLRIQNQNIEHLFAVMDDPVVNAMRKWAIRPRSNAIMGRNLRVEIGLDLGHGKNFLVLPGGKLVFIDP